MKKLCYLAAFVGLISTGCRKIEVDGGTITVIDTTGGSTSDNPILEGRISANRTLKANVVYKLRGLVYVTNGAILTIEPGTKIVGELNKQGGLIITRVLKLLLMELPISQLFLHLKRLTRNVVTGLVLYC